MPEVKEYVAKLDQKNDLSKFVGITQLTALGRKEYLPKIVSLWKKNAMPGVKSAILDAIKRMGTEEHLPLVRKALKDNEALVRAKAAAVAAELKDEESLDTLLDMMENESEGNMRKMAAIAIGKMGNRRVVPQILEMLKGSEPDNALRTLGYLGTKDEIEHVGPFTEDKYRTRRELAYEILAGINDDAVMPYLLAGFRMKDDYKLAQEALIKMGDRGTRALIKLHEEEDAAWMRRRIEKTLEKLEEKKDA